MSRIFNRLLTDKDGKCDYQGKEYRFFCQIPNIGICYFKSLESAEAFGRDIFDFEQADETDMEEYTQDAICGEIKSVSGVTFSADRPDNIPLNEAGTDAQGNHWEPEWSRIESWGFLPLQVEPKQIISEVTA